MQAVIFAGGLGTRLRSVAGDTQKCMVPVRGRPFLSYVLDQVRDGGVLDVVVLIGHHGDAVREYVGDGSRVGLRVAYSADAPDGALMGTGGALKRAQPLLHREFLLMNGDTFLPFSLDAFVTHWQTLESEVDGVIAAYDERNGPSGVIPNIAMDDRGVITGHRKGGGAPAYRYGDAGVAIYRSSVLGGIPSDRAVSLEDGVVQPLVARRRLRGWPVPARFFDIGTPEGLTAFEASLG